MFIGLDRDSGRSDAATPATRADAESALRAFTGGETGETGGVGMSGFVSKEDRAQVEGVLGETDGPCPNGCPPGVCLGKAIEAAVSQADAKGLKPDNPEFGAILERVFADQNPDFQGTVSFFGAHKVNDPMPDALRAKLGDAFKVSEEELKAFVDGLPQGATLIPGLPGAFDAFRPLRESTALTPVPPFYREPSNVMSSTIGGDEEVPDLGPLLDAIFGTPPAARLEGAKFEDNSADFERERREVVQDLSAAAADVASQLDEPGAEAVAEALRDIAALARDTYED